MVWVSVLESAGGEDVEYFVEIVNFETGEVSRRMGPMSERRADKVADGASINMDHERFFVRVVNE